MSIPIFSFDGYTVRAVEERDRAFIEQQIAADPHHAGKMTADYFLHMLPGVDSWAIENRRGQVVLYFRTKVVTRLALLFGNQEGNENREVLTKGVEWLVDTLAHNRFHEIIFDTDAPGLRAMAKRRLGFEEQEKLLVRVIPPPEIDERLAVLWNRVPQASEEEGVR